MVRSLLGVVVVGVLITMSACDADDDPQADPTSSSSSSESSDPSDSGTTASDYAGDTDLEAKVVAGVPPADLSWSVPDVPAGWKQASTENGTRQWQLGDSRCVVTLDQPSGLGTGPTPDSDQVATDYAKRAAGVGGGTPALEPAGSRMVDNDVNDGGLTVQSKVSTVHFTSTGDIEGQGYGYRDGDFALAAVAICGGGEFADHATELESFLTGLGLVTTY